MSEKRLLQPWTCACCSYVNPAPQKAISLLRQQSLDGRDEPLVSCRMCGKILSKIDAGKTFEFFFWNFFLEKIFCCCCCCC